MSTWPIAIRVDSGTVYERSRLNIVAGTNVTLSFSPGTGPGNEGTITVNSSGGGGGAPTDATYITASTNGTLSAERVGTSTATVAWDFGTPGQALLNVVAGSIGTASLTDGNVTNAKLANMAEATVKGRAAGAGTGVPVDLTATQATAILNAFTDALKGLAPASGGGTDNYLRADGSWAAPPGSGGLSQAQVIARGYVP